MESFIIKWWQEIINFLLLTVCLATFFIKRLFNRKDLILIGIFILVNLFFEVYATYLTAKGINNLFLYHILNFIQFIIIFFQFKLLNGNDRFTHFQVLLFFPLLIFLIVNSLFFESLKIYPSLSIIAKNLIFCILSLAYYKKILNSEEGLLISKDPIFWLVTGVLICSFCGMFVEGSMKYLIHKNLQIANNIFFVWLFINYLFYSFVIYSFFLVRKWED